MGALGILLLIILMAIGVPVASGLNHEKPKK